jgi:hypothetical protein
LRVQGSGFGAKDKGWRVEGEGCWRHGMPCTLHSRLLCWCFVNQTPLSYKAPIESSIPKKESTFPKKLLDSIPLCLTRRPISLTRCFLTLSAIPSPTNAPPHVQEAGCPTVAHDASRLSACTSSLRQLERTLRVDVSVLSALLFSQTINVFCDFTKKR